MKKGNKIVFVIVIIFMIVGVILFGYYGYTEFFDSKTDDNSDISTVFKFAEDTNKIYQSSDVLTKGNNNYLVVKKNDKWYEIANNYSEDNTGFQILGAYKDKLYYVDLKGIKYVDLNDESLKINDYSMKDKIFVDNVYKAYFSDNTLFVEVDDNPDANVDESEKTTYSIISYDLNSNYININGKKLFSIKDDPVNFYVVNNKLIYLYDYKNDEYKLKSYELESEKTSTIMENICNMDIYKNYLIVTKINPIDNDEKCSLHYFYDVGKDKEIYLTNKELHAVVGDNLYFQDNDKIYEFSEKSEKVKFISNGKMNYSTDILYYLNDNKIYKYENNKSSLVYTGDDKYKIRGFNIENDSNHEVIYVYTRADSYAIVDGKKQDMDDIQKSYLKYKVNMKDGSVKTFDYSSDDVNDDIVYDEELDENEE